jgi:uncharacterized YigZ family protein
MSHYPIPAEETRIETRVVNSRFIATAGPAFSVDEARAFITRIRREFDDATHNVPAYLIGHGHSVIAHCSDDGEPSGTAGPPALAVLRGSDLGDVVVVVTRYFGGTKLGTGGLVRAYGDAVREVLAVLPRAQKVPTHTARIEMPYSAFEPIRRLVGQHQGRVLDETFAAEVTMMVQLSQDRFPAFQNALREISAGKIEAEVVESNEATILIRQC